MHNKGMCGMRVYNPLMTRKKSGLESIEILHKGQACTPFVQLVHLPCIISITFLYNGANSIHIPLATLYNPYPISSNVLYS